MKAATEQADIEALSEAIKGYYQPTEGRAKHCRVEPYRRGELEYFFAFPEDYAQNAPEWKGDNLDLQSRHPPFEIVFVWDAKDGRLELHLTGDKNAVKPLQEIFAKAILKCDKLPDELTELLRAPAVVEFDNLTGDRVTLIYRTRDYGGEWQPMEYPVFLELTACHLGGRRAWFRCPARGCGRRVAVLYGGSIFACRHCHRLAYDSQRERWDDRLTRRADKIRQRLGWEPGILNGDGDKPKGMHWRTFERLQAEHDAYVESSLAGMLMRFGKIAGDIGL